MVSSDNSVYAQLTNIVGPKAIVEIAHRLGIRSNLQAYFSIWPGLRRGQPARPWRGRTPPSQTMASARGRLDLRPAAGGARRCSSGRAARWSTTSPLPDRSSAPAAAATMTTILERVVEQGTGQRAQLADRTAARKTGTNDNYADAWFVGYTPELAVAVWVGYGRLRPMETEFNGGPSAGRHPARADLEGVHDTRARACSPTSFPPPPCLPSYDARVVFRGGKWRLDNGFTPPPARTIRYFAGRLPESTAACYASNYSVPVLVSRSVESARVALRSHVPLAADVVYVPHEPRTRPGEVMKQTPRAASSPRTGQCACGSPPRRTASCPT